jgi:hypothetical protein
MRELKVLLAMFALLVAGFLAVYSIDYGCFLCLNDDLRGSAAEKWTNRLFVLILAGASGWYLWHRFSRTPPT